MTTRIRRVVADAERMRRDLILEAFTDGLAMTWGRREIALLDARPRATDYHGRASREQLDERWQRLTDAAAACRARAELIRLVGLWDDELAAVDSVLDELDEAC